MAFEKEADFEAALIRQLTEKHGWEPEVLRYPTEEDLLRNWAAILFENNRSIDRLNDVPLTEGEMNQLLEQIQKLRTPVALNDFVNGKEVTIVRDNPDDGLHYGREVSLHLYDRMEIAAGRSRYQIAEQPVFRPKGDFYPKRRGDFTLLINGMPLIHVELKRSGVDISRACNQIRLYAHEGVFTGLFSLVQIFVAMTPEKALYFANPGPEGTFNPAFYFHWADFNNEYIEDWQCVAEHLLSIPMAHQLIGFYTVADRQDGILKVMRSYQYYAASKIADAVHERDWSEKRFRGGYIWHTTGSGKTMTSFKSAQLIAASRDADKVVFLMDRIELGTQSLREYRGFSRDDRAVAETEDTDALAAKLKSDDPADTLIVTSIRKMAPQLKVTALFDPSTDGRADAVEKEESIREIVEDYNERYGMHFQMATYGSFKKDAAARLAHREPYRNADRAVEERLDLLIVVDQMLTGFDSKWVNTLYLDKVIRYEMLIQAFSRTNRIFGPEKPFGIIRYYRKPHTMKRNVEDAFRLYSGDRPYGLFVEKLRTNLKRMAEAAARIREIFTDGGVPDLSHIPDDKTERGAFARAFRELNEYLEAAKVQGFSWEKESYDFREEDGQPAETVPAPMDEQTYLTLAQRYKELFRKDDEDGDEGSGTGEDTAYEIDPYLTEINTDRIDTAYMTSRFRKYLKALQDASETAGVLAELHRSFASLSREEQRYAESFLNDIRDNTIHVSGEKSFRWYLAKYMERAQNDEIHRFAGLIGVEEDRLRRLIARHPNAKTINAYDDLEKLKANMDMDRAKNFLESLAGKSLSTFQIRMQADKQLRSFILNGHITRPAVKTAKADEADKAAKAAEAPAPYGK